MFKVGDWVKCGDYYFVVSKILDNGKYEIVNADDLYVVEGKLLQKD